MRVITAGKVPEECKHYNISNYFRVGTCRSCGCEIEYKESELDSYKETPFLGTHNCYVPCPTEGCCFNIRMIPKIYSNSI